MLRCFLPVIHLSKASKRNGWRQAIALQNKQTSEERAKEKHTTRLQRKPIDRKREYKIRTRNSDAAGVCAFRSVVVAVVYVSWRATKAQRNIKKICICLAIRLRTINLYKNVIVPSRTIGISLMRYFCRINLSESWLFENEIVCNKRSFSSVQPMFSSVVKHWSLCLSASPTLELVRCLLVQIEICRKTLFHNETLCVILVSLFCVHFLALSSRCYFVLPWGILGTHFIGTNSAKHVCDWIVRTETKLHAPYAAPIDSDETPKYDLYESVDMR